MGITQKVRGKQIMGDFDLLARPDRVLRRTAVTLTAAQVKALNTTPLAIVTAPGTSKFNVVSHVFAKHTFTTTAFTGSNKLEFRYTSSNGGKCCSDIDNAILLATATAYRVAGASDDVVPVANAPITVSVPSADPGQGLGSLTLQVFYRTITA